MATASPDARQALDALEDAVAIIDGQGMIVATNVAWRRFLADAGSDACGYLGRNHLDACRVDREGAIEVSRGLRQVIAEGVEFRHEYSCHTPTEQRRFELLARRLDGPEGPFATVVHRTVTQSTLEVMQARAARVNAGLF